MILLFHFLKLYPTPRGLHKPLYVRKLLLLPVPQKSLRILFKGKEIHGINFLLPYYLKFFFLLRVRRTESNKIHLSVQL